MGVISLFGVIQILFDREKGGDEFAESVDVYKLPTARVFRSMGSRADWVTYGKSPVYMFLSFHGDKDNVVVYIFQINMQYCFGVAEFRAA